jgi:hypothetical protein
MVLSRSLPAARVAAVALTVFACTVTACTVTACRAEGEQRRLVVHEWGTFTTVSAADGSARTWNPFAGPSELPEFVYSDARLGRAFRQCGTKCSGALVRMETPVIYFYADRETQVSVKVGFPNGSISEWYPQAQVVGSTIEWGRVTVAPGATDRFPTDRQHSHYYPARETDAAPVRVPVKGRVENEKFLFYRGVGNFDLPIEVRLADESVIIRNTRPDEIAQVILFENRGGRFGWHIHGPLSGQATIARPTPGQAIEPLLAAMERSLVAQGLFPKEAAAMMKTWNESWIEEGLRVFYLLPRAATDRILPLELAPAPRSIERVFVGRAEILTPDRVSEILVAAERFAQGPRHGRADAVAALRRHGRFAEPLLHEALLHHPERAANPDLMGLVLAALLR